MIAVIVLVLVSPAFRSVDAQDSSPSGAQKRGDQPPALNASCGVKAVKKPVKSHPSERESFTSALADDGSEITVLVVYTHAALADYSSVAALTKEVQDAIDLTNKAFSNSDIHLRVRIVGISEVSFVEASDSNDDLDRIANQKKDASGGTIHDGDQTAALRQTYKADVVSLIRHGGDRDGTSYMLQDPLDLAFDREHAFTAIKSTCVAHGYNCFTHELGHVLGCAHDRANVDVIGRFPTFSYGYAFDPPNDSPDVGTVGTMMSYDGANHRLPYFSNPNVSYGGRQTGEPEKLPDGKLNPTAADNARTIRESQLHVANYMRNAP